MFSWVLSIMLKNCGNFNRKVKWKDSFRLTLLPTGITGITSGGGPLLRSEYSDGNLAFHFWQIDSLPSLSSRMWGIQKSNKKWQEPFVSIGTV